MIINPNSHPDERINSISAPNHRLIQAVISNIQSKFASTKYGCEPNETHNPRTELD